MIILTKVSLPLVLTQGFVLPG